MLILVYVCDTDFGFGFFCLGSGFLYFRFMIFFRPFCFATFVVLVFRPFSGLVVYAVLLMCSFALYVSSKGLFIS